MRVNIKRKNLSAIPYTFKRPLPNQKVTELIQRIQTADRNAGFTIGGVAKYIINYVMEERRKNRKMRRAQRIGVSAQRFNGLSKRPFFANIFIFLTIFFFQSFIGED